MYHLYRGGSVESFRKNNICTTTDFYIKCSDMPQVKAQTHRTQLENRVSARRRLAELLEAQLPLVGYKTWTIQPVARLQSGRAKRLACTMGSPVQTSCLSQNRTSKWLEPQEW